MKGHAYNLSNNPSSSAIALRAPITLRTSQRDSDNTRLIVRSFSFSRSLSLYFFLSLSLFSLFSFFLSFFLSLSLSLSILSSNSSSAIWTPKLSKSGRHTGMYNNILIAPLRFPSYLSAEAKAVLVGLLTRPVGQRLGSKTDFAEIQQHAFYKSLDFAKVYKKEYMPEFVPSARGAATAANFDKEFTTAKALDSVVTSKLSEDQAQQAHFEGFTYQGSASIC